MTTALHHDPVVIDAVDSALSELERRTEALRYASVLTDDGFEVGALRRHPETNGDRFASISSSLQALGEAAARELRIDSQASVLVFSDAGQILQVRITGTPLVLAALFGAGDTIGIALSATRRTAAELGRELDTLVSRTLVPDAH